MVEFCFITNAKPGKIFIKLVDKADCPKEEKTQSMDRVGRGRVMLEMVEMNEPAFVPAAQHLPPRERREHRVNPQQPAGVRDGLQGPNLVVRNPEGSSENDSDEERRRIGERERRRDPERRSPCATHPRRWALYLALGLVILIIVVAVIIGFLLKPGERVNATDSVCSHHIGINPVAHC